MARLQQFSRFVDSRLKSRWLPDLDIYRAANVNIKQFGKDAPIHSAMQADAMLEKGDLDGYLGLRRSVVARALHDPVP